MGMAGTRIEQRPLGGIDPLHDLRQGWNAVHRRVTQSSELFWLPAGSELTATGDRKVGRGRDDKTDQTYPNHNALPGWFVAPSDDVVEIEVNIPLPNEKTIIRLLLDPNGQAKHAAVKGCRMGGLNEDIEEYDISVKGMETLPKRNEEH